MNNASIISRIRLITIIAMISCLSCSIPAITLASDIPNGVGIYFDIQCQSNCIDDVSSYPYFTTGYFVLSNPEFVSGVAGWEAKITSDSNILITVEVSGNELNIGTIPDYQVALSYPLLFNEYITLATISIVALGPGSIYISPVDNPSLPSASGPIYIPGAYPGVMVSSEYIYGSANTPVASIGLASCPELNLFGDGLEENYSVFSDSNVLTQGSSIALHVTPGVIAFETGVFVDSLSNVAIGDSDLLDIFNDYNITAIGMLVPQHFGANLTRVSRTGQIVELTDLSSYYVAWYPNKLSESSLIEAISETRFVTACRPTPDSINNRSPNDLNYNLQWSLKNSGQTVVGVTGTPNEDIRIEAAWDDIVGSSNIIVGISELGVKTAHPDLMDKFINDVSNVDEHGTMVSGIIGAVTNNYWGLAGIDWNAKLLWCDRRNQGSINAIYYAINNDASVLNHSYHLTTNGSPSDEDVPFHMAMIDAHRMNIVNIAASGNRGHVGNEPQIPSRYSHVLSVGSVDNQGNRYFQSTYGPYLDVMAPGHNVYMLGSEEDFTYNSGTSFAAPHVSGIASLMLARNANLHNDDIYNILRLTARDITDYGVGFDEETGYGAVSANAAMAALEAPNLLTSGFLTQAPSVSSWSSWEPASLLGFGEADAIIGMIRYQTHTWYNVRYSTHYTETPLAWVRTAATKGYNRSYAQYNNLCGAEIFDVGDGYLNVRTHRFEIRDFEGQYIGTYPSNQSDVQVAIACWGQAVIPPTGALPQNATTENIEVNITPNPFNSTVELNVRTRIGGKYTAAIYDIRGRAQQIWSGQSAANEIITISWDGRTINNRLAASGNYYFSVCTNEDHVTKTLTLVK